MTRTIPSHHNWLIFVYCQKKNKLQMNIIFCSLYTLTHVHYTQIYITA